jgi:hypothetical protein
MRADYSVLLVACVLIPMPLADTLLRMAKLIKIEWCLDILSS